MIEGKNIIGNKIRIARLTRSPIISQKGLLARLDLLGIQLSETAISKIEAGTRCVYDYELPAIADALKVSVDWLLGREK